jgi:hypothetical protein
MGVMNSSLPGRSKRPMKWAIALSVLCACGAIWLGVRAQVPSKTQELAPPRAPSAWGAYSYPRSYDAEIADGDVHRVLYADDRVMFLEVTNPPGLDVHMHGHPYASVFVRDSGGGAAGPLPAEAPLPLPPPISPTTPRLWAPAPEV